jgi:chemotaxis protein methyltransferase CheR
MTQAPLDRGTPGWLERFGELLEQRTGVVLSPTSVDRLGAVLRARSTACGLRGIEEYVATLGLAPGGELGDELQRLVNLVTIGKTAFFRYPEQLRLIVELLVPALHRALPPDEAISIWSAACSTGEEIYSIAMALKEAGWLAQSRRFTLLGSDLNSESLAWARSAVVDLAHASCSDRLQVHLERQGDTVLVGRSVRELVRFQQVNLCSASYPRPTNGWHIILCSNVLIYFRPATVRNVIGRCTEALAPLGALLVGAAESVLQHQTGLQVLRWHEAYAYVRAAWRGVLEAGNIAGVELMSPAAAAAPSGSKGGSASDEVIQSGAGAPPGLKPASAAEPARAPPLASLDARQAKSAGAQAPLAGVERTPPATSALAGTRQAAPRPLPPGLGRRSVKGRGSRSRHGREIGTTRPSPAACSMQGRKSPPGAAQEAATVLIDRQIELAIAAAARGHRDRALAILTPLRERYPQHGRLARATALLLIREARFAEACAAFEDAIATDPLAFELHFYVGFLYMKLRRLPAAIEAMRHCLFLEPGFALGRYQFALALHAAEDFDRAADEYRRAERDIKAPQGRGPGTGLHGELSETLWLSEPDLLLLIRTGLSLALERTSISQRGRDSY